LKVCINCGAHQDDTTVFCQCEEALGNSISDGGQELIEKHGDIFYKCEIRDDFRGVRIDETPGGIGRSGFVDLRPGLINRIQHLIGLYHNVKEGRSTGLSHVRGD